MADKDAATPPPGGAAGDPKSGQSGVDRAKGILAELAEAMRTVAEALADEQRARAAGRVAAVAAAVRGAAQSLAQSEMPTVAHCAGEAADRIEDFSAAVRERRWRDIVTDTEDFARDQPALFALAATAAGFIAGRVLSLPGQAQGEGAAPETADRAPGRRKPEQEAD